MSAAEDSSVTETTYDVVCLSGFTMSNYHSYAKAMEGVENLRALNDPSFTPSHLLRIDVTTKRTETLVGLAGTSVLSVDDIFSMMQERHNALGDKAPQGEQALRWAIEETLKVNRAVQK